MGVGQCESRKQFKLETHEDDVKGEKRKTTYNSTYSSGKICHKMQTTKDACMLT